VIQNLQCDAVCAHTCKLSAFQWVNKCTWIAIQWHLFFLWYAEDIYLEYMKVHRRRDIPIASKIFGLPNNHYKCVSNGVNFQICTQQYATGTFGPTFMAPQFHNKYSRYALITAISCWIWHFFWNVSLVNW